MTTQENPTAPIVIYQTADGSMAEVRLEGETVWLSQKQMAELFDKNIMTINEHIANVFTERELESSATIRKFLIVRQEGKREVKREIEHYNLTYHFGRVSRQIQTGHAIPYLGQPGAEGLSGTGLRTERATTGSPATTHQAA